MARNILAEMVISLKDNLSADAKKAASSLNQVKKAADNLNKSSGTGVDRLAKGLQDARNAAIDLAKAGKSSASWGSGFQKTLERLKATPAEVAKIRKEFDAVATALGHMDAKTRANGLRNYLAGAKTHLASLRVEAVRTERVWDRMLGKAARFGVAAAGVGGAAYLTGKAVTASTEEGAQQVRERIRQGNAGITAAESARLNATAGGLAMKYPSMLPREIAEQGRLLIPNTGSVDKAMELLPLYTQAQVALKTAGGTGSVSSHDMADFSRFVDIINRSQNVGDTKELLDGFVRARQVDPEAISANDFVSAAQTAGAAGKGFSTDFWARVMPAIMMQQKGYRSGTDLASAYQNFMVGRGTQNSLEKQQDFIDATSNAGLRTGMVKKRGKVVDPGTLVDEGLYGANPYEWAKKHLLPRLIQEGIMPHGYGNGDFSENLSEDQRGKLAKRMSQLFSNRRGANMFELLLGDMSQLEAIQKRLEAAKGAISADSDQGKDPYVALEGLGKSLTALGAAVADPAVQDITPNLQKLAEGIAQFANSVRDKGLFRAMLPDNMRDVWDKAVEQHQKNLATNANDKTPLIQKYEMGKYQNPASAFEPQKSAAEEAGSAIAKSLSPEGQPTVDTSKMDEAVTKSETIWERIKAIFARPIPVNVQAPNAAGAPATEGRASGGYVGAGRFYTVGEQGPELFIPGSSGHIVPGSGRSRAKGSGKGSFAPSINLGGIHVNGAGMDADALADKVKEKIEAGLSSLVRSMYADYGLEEVG